MWNPLTYGGIWTQQYPVTDVWYPVLVLCNPYDSISDVGAKWMTVRYYSNGYALFVPGASFQVTCSVDVTYYPFDTQVNNVFSLYTCQRAGRMFRNEQLSECGPFQTTLMNCKIFSIALKEDSKRYEEKQNMKIATRFNSTSKLKTAVKSVIL